MSARYAVLVAACVLAPVAAAAQGPWNVVVTPTMNPLPVGFCAAIHLNIFDPAKKDIPRNSQGHRVTIADFDIAVTTPVGGAAVAQQVDASHVSACACQGASPGVLATVTATYPAQSLAAASRVAGVAFQRSATFMTSAPKGTFNPPDCVLASSTLVASTGTSTTNTPPASQPPSASAPAPGAVSAAPASSPPTGASPSTGVGGQQGALPPVSTGNVATPGTKGAAPSGGSTGSQPSPTQVVGGAGKTPTTPPAFTPVNPTGFAAVQTAPGQVQLSWQPVSGVAFYGLWGPGVANGGQQVMAGTTSFIATGVPGGSQQWSVGSYYPGQVTTGVGTFPITTLNVTAPVVASAPPGPASAMSGKYLVTVVGLRPYQASVDDFLSRDGMGDEVYAAAFVRRYDRKTGQLADYVSRQTAAYGDVNRFGGQRVQAGSASGTGGIRDGDAIPSGGIVAFRTLPAQDVLFPWRLWEGTLTDGADALVITPSIWEQDGGTAFYDQWVLQQTALNLSLFTNATIQDQITNKAFGTVVSGNSGASSGTTLGFQVRTAVDMTLMQFGLAFVTLLQTSSDRPIGLLMSSPDATMLPVQAVVLTREIIEAALAQPARGVIPSPVPHSQWPLATLPVPAPKPGIIVLHFQDDRAPLQGIALTTERPAIYQMFIQVERVP